MTSMEPATRRLRFHVVDGADAVSATALSRALETRGFELTEDTSTADLLAVVVLPEGSPEPSRSVSLPMELGEQVLPVVFGSRASALMADRSQLIRPVGRIDEVAARIDRLARVGGHDLIAVNEFTAAARRWAERGRNETDLLPASQAVDGPRLAALAQESGSPDGSLLQDFAQAGLAHEHRATRRRRRITTITAGVLAIVTVVAALGGVAAQRAAADARAKAATALSNRLSGAALSMLDKVPDPDLPWLLAGRALQADPTPEAQRVARMIASRIPAHHTIPLPSRALQMSGGSNGLLVVAYQDRHAELRNASGTLLRSFGQDQGTSRVAISPAGSRLALVGREKFLTNRAGDKGFPADQDHETTNPGQVIAARWLGDDLLLLTPNKLLRLSGNSTSATTVPTPGLGTLAGLDVTDDGHQLAVWGTRGMWFGTPNGTRLYSNTRIDLSLVVIQADGKAVHLLNQRGGIGVVAPAAATNKGAASPKQWSERQSTQGAFGLARANRTTFSLLAESVCALHQSKASHDGCLKVGADGLVDIAWLGSHGYATVSGDAQLRIWHQLGPGTNDEPYPTNVTSPLMSEDQSNALLRRSQIQSSDDGTKVWAISGSGGDLAQATTELTDYTDRFIGLPEFITHTLAPGGRFYASQAHGQGKVGVRTTATAPQQVWIQDKAETGTPDLVALSPNGAQYVSAGRQQVNLWAKTGSRSIRGGEGSPVGIVFGQPAGPTVYYSSGDAVSLGTGTPLAPAGRVLTVAGLGSDRLVWVDDALHLIELAQGSTRTIATLPRGSDVMAMRPSPDGTLIAVFTQREAYVYRASDGHLLYASASSTENETVQDVAFMADGMIVIDHFGRLSKARLTDDFTTNFRDDLPRAATAEEKRLFTIPEEA